MKHYVVTTNTCADRIAIAPTIIDSADKYTSGSRDKN